MKKNIRILGIFMFLGMMMSFIGYQINSSLTKADYVEGSRTLKFTTKLGTAEISKTLNIDPNSAGFEAEVKKYVGKNFVVTINGENKNLTFNGSQINGDAVFIYSEVTNVGNISTLKIRNSILLSTYPKQLNMVNIAYKGDQKNMTFQRGKETAEVSF